MTDEQNQKIDEQDNDEIDYNDQNRPLTSISIDRHCNLLQIPSIHHHESVDPNERLEYWPDETWFLQGHHHLPVRRHRSLPATSFTSAPRLSNRANQQRSSSFRVRSNNCLVNQEPNGRWRIKVKKNRPFLGIAIEGGSNVSAQSQPRIINIQEGGAAAENLHVGHIILEVD
ncbi:PDZ domain containing protein, partial [Euroglyphus maynei]